MPPIQTPHRLSLPSLLRRRGGSGRDRRRGPLHRCVSLRSCSRPFREERRDRALARGEGRGHFLFRVFFLDDRMLELFVVIQNLSFAHSLFLFSLPFSSTPLSSLFPAEATEKKNGFARRRRRLRAKPPGMEAPAGELFGNDEKEGQQNQREREKASLRLSPRSSQRHEKPLSFRRQKPRHSLHSNVTLLGSEEPTRSVSPTCADMQKQSTREARRREEGRAETSRQPLSVSPLGPKIEFN